MLVQVVYLLQHLGSQVRGFRGEDELSHSVAVQVAPDVKPLTVKFAGSAIDAVGSSLTTAPLVHTRLIVTSAGFASENVLATTNYAVSSELQIVQLPGSSRPTPEQAVLSVV